MKKTNEEFLKEVYDLVQDEYSVLSEYKGNKNKVGFKHNVCDNIFEMTPNNFLRGQRCPYCYGNKRKTTEQFKAEVYNLVGNEYTVLDKYKNNKTKIEFKHNVCGNLFKMQPGAFLRGQRCPYERYSRLAQVKAKTIQQFKDEASNLVGDEYSVVGEYKNTHTKIKIKHNKCGNTYEVTPNKFLQGRRCPICYQKGSSHGNECITKYLDNHNISYEREYRFKDCVYKASLPFDFYLKDYNVAIEYDGIQHYTPIEFFAKCDPFKERKIKDNIKSKYCYQHNIKLIRIPYYKFNEVDKILDKELKTK